MVEQVLRDQVDHQDHQDQVVLTVEQVLLGQVDQMYPIQDNSHSERGHQLLNAIKKFTVYSWSCATRKHNSLSNGRRRVEV